jgi:hypothetical protein
MSELLKQIAERLHAMRAFDREIDALNHRRPDDRSVRPLDYATPELARELKLPDPDKPSQFLWPPPQPNLTLQMIAAIRTDSFIISEAAKGTYIKERDRRVLEDNRRQIAEAESSASASLKSGSAKNSNPPRSATGRLIASAGGRADNSLG